MSSRAIRYGVVGAGRVFERYHLPSVRARGDFELVAVCDSDTARAASALGWSSPNDVPARVVLTNDLERFFRVGRPDVIVVSTPNQGHREPVMKALQLGVRVLCEKPLAAEIGDARAIVAADTTGLVAVNLPYRFHQLLGRFGAALPDACTVTLRFTTAGPRLWRPVSQWYGDRRLAGGGALLDLGPHALDLLATLLGPLGLVEAEVSSAGMEERARLSLTSARGPVVVEIDRSSRRLGLTLTAAADNNAMVELDLRRGRLTVGKQVHQVSTESVELAAISRFLDAASGRPAVLIGATEVLPAEEIIHQAYGRASVDPDLLL